jgi:hypothetical protein
MEQVSSLGPMVENMKVNISTTRNKVMVYSHGQMDVNTMVSG